MLEIKPIEQAEITRLICPSCKEKVPRVGLLKGSKISGLSFKCRKCGKIWEAKTE